MVDHLRWYFLMRRTRTILFETDIISSILVGVVGLQNEGTSRVRLDKRENSCSLNKLNCHIKHQQAVRIGTVTSCANGQCQSIQSQVGVGSWIPGGIAAGLRIGKRKNRYFDTCLSLLLQKCYWGHLQLENNVIEYWSN